VRYRHSTGGKGYWHGLVIRRPGDLTFYGIPSRYYGVLDADGRDSLLLESELEEAE
jgi:hypothetical protein